MHSSPPGVGDIGEGELEEPEDFAEEKGAEGAEDAEAETDMSEMEEDGFSSNMTGTIEYRPLPAHRLRGEASCSVSTSAPSPDPPGPRSLSAEVVAQTGSSLSQIAETQRQQQAALLSLNQRVE